MGVADRHRQRVGGVVRRGKLRQPEQSPDHDLDLALLGAAVPGHGLLDLERSIFADRDGTLGDRQKRHAARLPDRQSGADILLKKRLSTAAVSGAWRARSSINWLWSSRSRSGISRSDGVQIVP